MNKQQTRKSATGRKVAQARTPATKARVVFARPKSAPAKKAAAQKSAPRSAAVGRFLGSTAAGLIPGGSPFAALAGEAGAWIGNKIGTFLGLGAYRVNQNSLVGEGSQVPYMHNAGDRSIVRHRESLGNVFSSSSPGAFSVQNFPLNPGLFGTFPWGSIGAKAYREYEPLGIVFEFISNTGLISSAPTPNIGVVIMSTDYNAYDTAPFQNKIEMENNLYTTVAKTTESFCHPIECDPGRNVLRKFFLRNGALPVEQPPQLYDLGTFAIASQGQPTANQNLGELWVTYEFAYSKATLQNQIDNEAPTDMFAGLQANQSAFLGVNGQPFFTATNTLGGYVNPAGGTGTYAFPVQRQSGDFLVLWYGTNFPGLSTQVTVNINCFNCVNETPELQAPGPIPAQNNGLVPLTPAYGAGGAIDTPPLDPREAYCTLMFKVRLTGQGAFFTLTNGPAASFFSCQWQLIVVPIAHSVNFFPPELRRFNRFPPGIPEIAAPREVLPPYMRPNFSPDLGKTSLVVKTEATGRVRATTCGEEDEDSDDDDGHRRNERVEVLLEQLERLRFLEHQHQSTKRSKVDST